MPVRRPDTAAAALPEMPASRPDTPAVQPSLSLDTPGPSFLGTQTTKKRRKRPNKLHRAEVSAKDIMNEVMEGQEEAKRQRHDLEE